MVSLRTLLLIVWLRLTHSNYTSVYHSLKANHSPIHPCKHLPNHRSTLTKAIEFFNAKEEYRTTIAMNFCDVTITTAFGNFLSDYLEARLCATLTNKHFVAEIHRMNSTNTRHNDLIRIIPQEVLNNNASLTTPNFDGICPCRRNCHELSTSLLHQHSTVTRNIIRSMYQEHSNLCMNRTISLSAAWKYLSPLDSGQSAMSARARFKLSMLGSPKAFTPDMEIPLIPDVAIHYRCSDNILHNKMGLTSFSSFLRSRFPSSPGTIYILSEREDRPSINHANRIFSHLCNPILEALMQFLHEMFPTAAVMVFRGASLLDDTLRIMHARVSFCSLSTFCLFPAMASFGKVYVPYVSYFRALNTTNLPHLLPMSLPTDKICGKGVFWNFISDPPVVISCLNHSCNCRPTKR